MAIGLYRTNDGFVQVAYGRKTTFPISRKRYEERGYQPPFESLPAEQGTESASEMIERAREN